MLASTFAGQFSRLVAVRGRSNVCRFIPADRCRWFVRGTMELNPKATDKETNKTRLCTYNLEA